MSNSIVNPRDPAYCETCGGECVTGTCRKSSPHRLYGVFYERGTIDVGAPGSGVSMLVGNDRGTAMWALHRNGKQARKLARLVRGLCVSMPLPVGDGPWDAPTFRALADRVECDYRPKEK